MDRMHFQIKRRMDELELDLYWYWDDDDFPRSEAGEIQCNMLQAQRRLAFRKLPGNWQ